MVDNTIIPVGAGGDTIRDVDRGAAKTQVVVLDGGGETYGEQLTSNVNPLPVADTGNEATSGLGMKEILLLILMELRVLSAQNHAIGAQGFIPLPDDPASMRSDPSIVSPN